MKTELIHSYSSASLSSLASLRKESSLRGNFYSNSEYVQDDDKFPTSICAEFIKKTFRRKTIERKLPVLKWLPKYTLNSLVADIIAGFTVGLTILPQGLAYATVGGLPPQYGLYSGFVGCFVYILLGSTSSVTIGPTAIMAIITNTYTHGRPAEYAVILCFLTGAATFLMGVFQLGFIVNFISTPVNSGFTSAAALTICSTQIKGLLGLKFIADGFIGTLTGTFAHLNDINVYDSIMSIFCIVILLVFMKLQLIFSFLSCAKNPIVDKILWFISTARNAIVVIGMTVVSMCIQNKFTIVGHIESGLPDFKLPPFNILDKTTNVTHSFANILEEEGSAVIVMPLLAVMEHITIAKAFAGSNRIDASQEMISIGVSNLIGCFFSSMPICGSFSRTTVNEMSGARSPMGGLLTGTIVILALKFLTPYFFFISKASLSAVIVCAVIFMVDFSLVKPLWRSKKMELVPWGLTFLVSLFVGLEFGMMTGFLISVTYLLYYAARPGVKVKKGLTSRGSEFILVELDRSLTFPSVDYIRYVITKSASSFGLGRIPVVIDCIHIQFTDYTAAEGLKGVLKALEDTEENQSMVLYRAKPSFLRILNAIHDNFPQASNEEQLEIFLDSLKRPTDIQEVQPSTRDKEKFSSVPLS